jgi:hypothetical protein
MAVRSTDRSRLTGCDILAITDFSGELCPLIVSPIVGLQFHDEYHTVVSLQLSISIKQHLIGLYTFFVLIVTLVIFFFVAPVLELYSLFGLPVLHDVIGC